MSKSTMDDAEKMKRLSRRRLVGAVTLTTIIVVMLPIVLDSEPGFIKPDIDLRIPDKETAGEFNPKLPTAAPVEIEISDLSGRASETSIPTASTPAASTSTSTSTSTASAPTVSVKPTVPPVEALPGTVSIAPAATKEKAAPAKALTHPAPNKVSAAPAKPPVRQLTKNSGSFVIQVGAFTNANSANDLKIQLSQMNIKAYTEKIDDKTRVRAGPYSTKAAADKVLKKLEAQGLMPVVISPAANMAN